MKNGIIGILVTGAVIGGGYLIIKGASYQYAENRVNAGETYLSPAEFKNGIVDGCVREGTEINRSYCECAVNHMETAVGQVRLQAIALEFTQSNETPPEMTAAAYACLDKYVVINNEGV